MTNYTDTIREAITSALDAIRAAQKEVFAHANQQRESLIELLAEMRDTANVIHDMSGICEGAGSALIDIAEESAHVADVMNESTYDFDLVPNGSYEGLVGFCDECGREIRADEKYNALGNDDFVCSDCMDERDAEAEPDTTETEPAATADHDSTDDEGTDAVEETVEA